MKQAYRFAVAMTVVASVAACDTSSESKKEAEAGKVAPAPGTVTGSPVLDDASITTAVQSRYFMSDAVKGRDIDVDTRNGVVTLSGVVSTPQEKEQAITLAKETKGVTRVEDQLRVSQKSAATASNPADRWDTNERSPSWINTRIQAQYYLNPGLKPWRIDVTTSPNGAVRLSGRVESESDRAEALRIARNTEGVTSVDDQLRVQSDTAATTGTAPAGRAETTAGDAGDRAGGAADSAADSNDGWITAKIQSKYFMDTTVKGRDIDVDTKDGVVTLRGTVRSAGERIQALSLARGTEGVRDVRDELKIEQPKMTSGEPDRASDPRRQVNDAWITTKLQSKYFLHDEIKSRQVDVTTKNGVVTLAGRVPTETAKYAAEELAKDTEGVSRVVNNLRVAGD